jgi:hypothetical protein
MNEKYNTPDFLFLDSEKKMFKRIQNLKNLVKGIIEKRIKDFNLSESSLN